jgi:hypothetical protein
VIPMGNIITVTIVAAWGLYAVLLVALGVLLLRGDRDRGSRR